MNNIKNRPVDFLAASFLIIFSILLGLNQVMVKLVNEGMHPVFQVALRSTFAIFPILIYCYILKKKIIINNGSLIPGIIAGILFAIEFIFLFTALDYSTVTRVSLIFYTMPVWLTLAAHFLIENDKLNLNKILGLIIALVGLFLAVYEPTTGSNACSTGKALLHAYDSKCGSIIANFPVKIGTGVLSEVVVQGDNLYMGISGEADKNISGFTSKDNLITGKSKAKSASGAVQIESWKENY